jgi:hypothetical protein
MFFSISPNDYSEALLDEIYGCFKYIGIPIDTLMNMPVQTRKYFISKHNHDCEELDKKYNNDKSINVSGENTSVYTQMSMTDYKYLGPR